MSSNNLGPAPAATQGGANLEPVVEKIDQLRTDENAAATQASTQAAQRKTMLDQIRDRATITNNLLTQILAALSDGDEATTAALLTNILAALAQPFHVTVDNQPGAVTIDTTAIVAAINSASDEAAVDKIELVRALLAGVIASGAVKVSGPLTDTQLRASALNVSGPLTDVQLRASAVPVAGPLTDAQLRAAAVLVTGFPASQVVTGPLTDAQLRATALQVAGTVTATPTRGGLTDRSGTIATASTAQSPAAANTSRTYLVAHNPSTATDLYVNVGGTAAKAAGSIRLLPGGTATWENGFIPTGAVSVFGETAGAAFTIKEG